MFGFVHMPCWVFYTFSLQAIGSQIWKLYIIYIHTHTLTGISTSEGFNDGAGPGLWMVSFSCKYSFI